MYRLMRRITSLIHTSEIKILLNLLSIILVLILCSDIDHANVIFRTSPRATCMVIAGDLVPAGTTLVMTPVITPPSIMSKHMRATRGSIWGISPPEIFKTLHSNFDICRNFQRIKMKFYFLNIFRKSYWNFSLFYSIIISLQDLC